LEGRIQVKPGPKVGLFHEKLRTIPRHLLKSVPIYLDGGNLKLLPPKPSLTPEKRRYKKKRRKKRSTL
jgi:hypothetical protein